MDQYDKYTYQGIGDTVVFSSNHFHKTKYATPGTVKMSVFLGGKFKMNDGMITVSRILPGVSVTPSNTSRCSEENLPLNRLILKKSK